MHYTYKDTEYKNVVIIEISLFQIASLPVMVIAKPVFCNQEQPMLTESSIMTCEGWATHIYSKEA